MGNREKREEGVSTRCLGEESGRRALAKTSLDNGACPEPSDRGHTPGQVMWTDLSHPMETSHRGKLRRQPSPVSNEAG